MCSTARLQDFLGSYVCADPYQLFLAVNDVDHTETKVKSPQTNGICERFHKTVLQEFYQVASRKPPCIRASSSCRPTSMRGW